MKVSVQSFYHADTSTLTYVVFDAKSRDAVIIDPVLDFDPASVTYAYDSVEEVEGFLLTNHLTPHFVLDTHPHADHLTGAFALKERFPAMSYAIGAGIRQVQATFREIFHFTEFQPDGSQFDRLLQDGEALRAGTLSLHVLSTPGHTVACTCFLIGDRVFTGDTLFMPDYGTGRCDFPGGSAADAYDSITQKLYSLPESTRVLVGHDYKPGGRELRFESTIKEEMADNIFLGAQTSREEFVQKRTENDAGKKVPRLLYPSVQVNILGGVFPPTEANGVSYLKLPLRPRG